MFWLFQLESAKDYKYVTLIVNFDLLLQNFNIAPANLHNAPQGPSWLFSILVADLTKSCQESVKITYEWEFYIIKSPVGTLGFKMRIGPPYPHARRKRRLKCGGFLE